MGAVDPQLEGAPGGDVDRQVLALGHGGQSGLAELTTDGRAVLVDLAICRVPVRPGVQVELDPGDGQPLGRIGDGLGFDVLRAVPGDRMSCAFRTLSMATVGSTT